MLYIYYNIVSISMQYLYIYDKSVYLSMLFVFVCSGWCPQLAQRPFPPQHHQPAAAAQMP